MELKTILNDAIKRWHKREHYDYQRQFTDAILDAVVKSKTTAETFEIPIEMPRQSGKTTGVVDVVEGLLNASQRYLGRPLAIGIFAPQTEQATTDFDRLKMQYVEIANLGFKTTIKTEQDLKFPQKWNSKTIRIFSKSNKYLGEVFIFPLAKTSRIESKTLDVIIIEEAQDVDDEKMKNSVFPMGASTNAVRVYIGTAGTKLCYFKSQLDNNPRAIKIKLDQVLSERRKRFEMTGNETHLLYERYVLHEIEVHGKDSDYIQRQYFLVWKIGSGQFTTPAILDALNGPFKTINENKTEYELDEKGNVRKSRSTGEPKVKREAMPCYAGLDSAKSPDQTVVTVIRDTDDPKALEFAKKAKAKIAEILKVEESSGNAIIGGMISGSTEDELKTGKVSQLCNWLSIRGTNYQDQFTIITKWLSQFENLKAIAIDATGQGDFMPDMFERHTGYNIIRVKFSAETKDVLYKNLDQVQKNALTLLPDVPMDSNYRTFRKEMIELLKEYKGRFLACHHPEKDADGKPGHDDFPDSWALAEYAKSKHESGAPGLSFI